MILPSYFGALKMCVCNGNFLLKCPFSVIFWLILREISIEKHAFLKHKNEKDVSFLGGSPRRGDLSGLFSCFQNVWIKVDAMSGWREMMPQSWWNLEYFRNSKY